MVATKIGSINERKQPKNLFFETEKEVMVIPDTDSKDNLKGYLLADRKHFLECKDKEAYKCNLFSMDRIVLKKGDNEFESEDKYELEGRFDSGKIKIKVNDRNLTLEYTGFRFNGWILQDRTTYKESLKLNRYYNSDCYGVRLTPFWYEKLSNLEIIK